MLGLSRRALSKRPAACIPTASRPLATLVNESSTSSSSADAVDSALEIAPSSIKISSFTSNATATPYHPFVHLPLLTFHPSAIPRSARPRSSEERQVVPLPSNLFNTPSRPSLLHKLVISYLASLRQGTASTKNRSEVNYSGKKIRPQKGTGSARLGSRGSPMLTGGGRAFGPRPKGPDGWKRKVNRKEERLGLAVGFSDKWRRGDLAIVESLGMDLTSTRLLASRLASRGWADALFVKSAGERSLEEAKESNFFNLSSANLSSVTIVSDPSKLGIWDILKRRKIVMELSAVDEVIKRLDPENNWNNFEDDDDEDWEDLEGGQDGVDVDDAAMAEEVERALKDIDLGGPLSK